MERKQKKPTVLPLSSSSSSSPPPPPLPLPLSFSLSLSLSLSPLSLPPPVLPTQSLFLCFSTPACATTSHDIFPSVHYSLPLSSAFCFSSFHLLLVLLLPPPAFSSSFLSFQVLSEHSVAIGSVTVSLETDRVGLPGVSTQQKSKTAIASFKSAPI